MEHITENQKKQSGHGARNPSAKFKIRFHIVSKALKTSFLIFCMRNKAKQKSKKCIVIRKIPQASNADFLSLRHKEKHI